jgi:hypothetical protein
MARGAGNQGGKGKGGGKGRGPTQRSQDYLARYGYPSSKELRREAEGLAGASVPSIRSVSQPYNRQAQSARDFLTAVQAVLGETQGQVGAAYDQATSSQQALDAATQSRLAGLGLGVDSAGVQAASGARGDSATANLLSNEASAKSFAAAQPGIAAGNTGVVLAGLRKQQTDALSNRRDQLRQSFFQALGQVQSQALARAGFNQSADQFHQQMLASQAAAATQASQFAQSQASSAASLAEQQREYNLTRRDANRAASASGGATAAQLGITPHELISYQQTIAQNIYDAKQGVPHKNEKGQILRGHWDVHPAPDGAPREPNQPNSIFALYSFLNQQYPQLQIVVLQALKSAYPPSTWKTFVNATFGQGTTPGLAGRHRQ